MPRISGGSKKKRSTGKGKPSRATGPGLSIMSDPTRGGMSFKNTRKWRKAEQVIAGLVDPTRFEKGAIKATRHMGREISPGTALPGPVPVSVWPKSQAIIQKMKTKKGVPQPERFWYNTSTPSSGPSSAQRGNISQPIDQAYSRYTDSPSVEAPISSYQTGPIPLSGSYKKALAQNIANGERQRMRPFPEFPEAPQPILSPAKNKGKRRGSPPPPPQGRTTIRKSRSKNY